MELLAKGSDEEYVAKVGDTVELDVWLIPYAKYHVEELGPLIADLASQGVRAGLVFIDPPSSVLLATAKRYTSTVFVAEDLLSMPPAIAVCLMDWGPITATLDAIRAKGTTVVSKVEGAQDLRNLDTPRRVLPYSRSDVVLAQGKFDSSLVVADNVEIVGSVRIEELDLIRRSGLAERVCHGPLVNLNFSYRTNTLWSKSWYRAALRGARLMGVTARTSVHPAVEASWVQNESHWPLALDLETSSHLISRCSTAVFDSLMLGRPVIYFNPHRERVWRSVAWDDAVPEARSSQALAHHLGRLSVGSAADSQMRRDFLLQNFISVDPSRTAVQRTTAAIIAARR